VSRNVFLGYVLGAAGSGKTSLLRALVGKRFQGRYEPTAKGTTVVNTVEIKGAEKYLVVRT
jgi:Ras family protein T1